MDARWLELEHLHQPDGFLSPGYVSIGADGFIAEVSAIAPQAACERVAGYALPGLPNVHSHAFQRAMAGFAERGSPGISDTFWTWRECMYDLALRITPPELEAVAAQLYVEMLEAGMTSVAEFHYLHHAPDGSFYEDRAELAEHVRAAADWVGMPLTMLPVFYAHAGVNRPIAERQRRFSHRSVDEFAKLVELLSTRLANTQHRLGIAPHSLRAVTPAELDELLALAASLGASLPVHMHIAEQVGEVEEVRAALGAPPISWLLDHVAVDARFCLVHATHATSEECARLARSGAVVGLCPETEANLGDGIFPLREYAAHQGAFGIGTDSNVRISAAGELRMLEYPQRLVERARNVLADTGREAWLSTGRRLFDACTLGGAQALGQPVGRIAKGLRADVVVLDAEHPRMIGHDTHSALDAFIFSAGSGAVRDVMVAGKWVVQNGKHPAREDVQRAFAHAMKALDLGSAPLLRGRP
jgi:formimidoylglutamate deiminase